MKKIILPKWAHRIIGWGGVFLLAIGLTVVGMFWFEWPEGTCRIVAIVACLIWAWLFLSLFSTPQSTDEEEEGVIDYHATSWNSGYSVYVDDDEQDSTIIDSFLADNDFDLGDSRPLDSGLRGDPGSPYTGKENMEYTDSRDLYDHELFMEETE